MRTENSPTRRLVLAAALAPGAGCAASVGVAFETWIPSDDARLYALVRGEDPQAPLMIWLHGGPGGAERPLFRDFDSGLERDLIVTYFDQRGAGRSYDPHADLRRLTIAQHLADLDRVVDALRQRLGREKVTLVGHSWGSVLGLLYLQAHPEKVAAFVGVGQVVATIAGQQSQAAFVREQAQRLGDKHALETLERVGSPPWSGRDVLVVSRLLDRLGGAYHMRPNEAAATAKAMLHGYVSPWGIVRLIQGNNTSLEAMSPELAGLDLRRQVTRVEAPVAFLLGRFDRVADSTLAAAYFETLAAPAKRLVWFERSAHNAPFEEPQAFQAALITVLMGFGVFARR